MADRRACSCRTCTSGSPRSGSLDCSSPSATKRASGSSAAITCTATRGANSALPVTDARIRWQTATIQRIERQTATVVSFFLAPSEPFAFKAGQHVDVRLTAPDGYQAERSYSIASAPESPDLIELTIERLE